MRYGKVLGAAVAALVGCAFLFSQGPVNAQGRGAAGQMPAGVHAMKAASGAMVLASGTMMTLYTFAKDMPGVSNCNDNCAKNWPPLAAAADAKPMGDWTVITRADGSKQWAFKGMPLYTWSKDAKPGDTTGEGMGQGAWKIAAP
ncbi:MAG: COG4315 family predicted lipoprotein [Vicinamibacterales bacterium]